ncbi:uncharacterized protein LOC110855986 [Folsomia candida]|uniref:Uncharacterized protein n=1 Tax=Folsomia candida TaxID=158441 RepID=A0A226DP79_FOLCA|nr:uncharacterized protein LOC110855986 [Folsomia candida]OXA46828.1 hypothetical protein Fcan01_18413 [Folsomia candida]
MAQKVIIFASIFFFVAVSALKLELIRDEYERLGTKADFYDEEYQNGMSTHFDLPDGACKNMPRRWLSRAQAVDTRGTCVSACTEKDCQGTCVLIIPGNGEQKLSDIKMAKRIQSVQGCFVEGSQKGKA